MNATHTTSATDNDAELPEPLGTMRFAYAGFVVVVASGSGWALYLTDWALATKIFGWVVLPLVSIPMLFVHGAGRAPRDAREMGFILLWLILATFPLLGLLPS